MAQLEEHKSFAAEQYYLLPTLQQQKLQLPLSVHHAFSAGDIVFQTMRIAGANLCQAHVMKRTSSDFNVGGFPSKT